MSEADSIGPSIRGMLKARAARTDWLFRGWLVGQGRKIKDVRPYPVYSACVLEAIELCQKATEQTRAVILTAEQIRLCEARALSQARARMFGRLPPTNAEWDAQLEHVRQAWANPQQEGMAA